jgi:hypothetical protein
MPIGLKGVAVGLLDLAVGAHPHCGDGQCEADTPADPQQRNLPGQGSAARLAQQGYCCGQRA